MCGRISTAFLSSETLKHHFSLDRLSPFNRSYNIAPSLPIPAIRQQDHQRTLDLLKWGLLPHRASLSAWLDVEKAAHRYLSEEFECVYLREC